MLRETVLLTYGNGKINPYDIEDYISLGGYSALKKITVLPPASIIETIKHSGLRGRGGAGFPTHIKLQSVADAKKQQIKYVICNADEGEPGTFKDKMLIENNPHLLIEGIITAGYACGAAQGYIYIRGEYHEGIKILEHAIKEAYNKKLLGTTIGNTGFSFELEIIKGAGSYLCGEELTLIESLEGKRGYPRIKPPFPAQQGLWQEPTLVNNVETLCNLPIIITKGAEFFTSAGTGGSKGSKLVCVSGDVNKPGVYEVEFGSSVKDIINDIAGGVKNEEEIKAVLLGGAAGTFANSSQLDVILCYDKMKEAGLTLGSGAIIVFGSKTDLFGIIFNILSFFKHESCGKCVPCRTGTSHLLKKWGEVKDGSKETKRIVLNKIAAEAEHIAATSLCPLGQSPVLPLRSAADNLYELIE